jgi:hypothetical protein
MATTLSLRQECRGGPLRADVEASRDLHGFNRLTILIHGFNNDQCDAWKAYDGFASLPDVGDGQVVAAFGELCEFFWPGDSPTLSGASYPFEIRRAIASGGRLYGFLKGLAARRLAPVDVQLVCHSLGCRVALELFKAYVNDGRPPTIRFARVLLMAAAVKVSMVQDPRALKPAAAACRLSRVLYSTADAVLRWAFPSGEFLAGEGFGTAVGRFGEPGSGTWDSRADMGRYGHGDYWRLDATGPQVKTWLGLAVARALNDRTLPDAPLPPPARPGGRTLLAREVGTTRPACGC